MTERNAGASDQPSDRVVEQRVRNRVIEYLEVTASFEAQQEYERDAPIAYVPYEVINQWEDWVGNDPRSNPDISDVYDRPEVEAMCQFQSAWEVVVAVVPDDYPSLSDVQAIPEWETLRTTAEAALNVFMRRGKMPEDHEVV
jgi:hypothetical protein